MKNILKKFTKYILIFVMTIMTLFLALVGTSTIPKQSIEENMKESAEYYKSKPGIECDNINFQPSYLHYYADSILLNIIYNIDSQKPVESTLWAKYYETIKMDLNIDFINTVERQMGANTQYLRYWHGSMMFLRPLLTIFNIEQIYKINNILLFILCIALFMILAMKSKKLAVAYVISMIMIVFPYVTKCLEYSWTFYIMFIASIIAVFIEKKGDKHLFNLFFITGIVTCFFDFLSTEILTCFIPLLLVLGLRKKDGRLGDFKDTLKFVIKVVLLWGIGYAGTWLAKWAISSIVLNINALEYVKDQAMLRVNGTLGINDGFNIYTDGITRNIHSLLPLVFTKDPVTMYIYFGLFAVILLALIDWKHIKEKWYSLILFAIALSPYVRYLLLANHSFRHCFFTFRDQMITIIALVLIMTECFNYGIIKKLKSKTKKAKQEQT